MLRFASRHKDFGPESALELKRVENATAVIWKTLLYVNGVRAVNRRTEGVVA